jgi:pimeloyl-ACP methyl ester carboxylesterase
MSQTVPIKTDTLGVPGASLYYEVRGSGPVLLMMPGGPADANVFRNIAGELATDFTVVTYDPRGLSRSTLVAPLDENRIVQIFADDVSRLLARMTREKAFVFASSGGATIGLDLAARHARQIDTIVPHEPPSPTLLPDTARIRAGMHEVVETYRSGDAAGAFQKFSALIEMHGEAPPPPPQGEPTPEAAEAMAMMQKNMALFFGDYMEAIADYEPDIKALRKASCRIVPGVGEDSEGELAHKGGLGLAKQLGTRAAAFPGAHTGFDSHPAAFAARLREVLEN